MYMRSCDSPSCQNKHFGKGMCNKHYQRWRHGTYDPVTFEDTTEPRAMSPEDRLDMYVPHRGPGCWTWHGSLDDKGYGLATSSPAGSRHAYRWVYEQLAGQVPDGMVLDHLCRNHACVNPDHLEPVTQKENTWRGLSGPLGSPMRTTCGRGHDVTDPNNVYVSPKGKRMCIPCQKMRHASRKRL